MPSTGVAIAALGWLVAFLQVPAAMRSRWKRVPLAVFASLAAAATVNLPAVITALDHASGVTDLATLVKHFLSAVSCCALVDWVLTLEEPRPGRWHARNRQACLAVLTVLAVLFCLAPRTETTSFTLTQASGMVTAYLLVFYGYFTTCSTVAARRFWHGARATMPGMLRRGIWLLTAGAAVGAVYGLAELALVSLRATGTATAATARALTMAAGLVPLSAGLILASLLVPPAGHALASAGRFSAYRSLRPLWQALTTEAPDVILSLPTRPLGLPAGLEMRMIRRVAEIRDGILLMRRRVGPAALAAARERLADCGLDGPQLDAATEACAVELGLRIPRSATPLAAASPGAASSAGGTDLASEIAFLRAVSSLRATPQVQRVAGTLAATTAPGRSPAVTSAGGPRD